MANEQHHPDGWLQDGSLLYRLTDDAHPVNRDEINVAMADGSRSVESCTRRAGELLDCIRAGQAALFAAADASELPKVPDSVLCYVHAYGDSRADDDGRSGLRIGELILALRRWAKSIAAPTIQAAPAAVAVPSEWPTNAMIEAGRKAAESHGPLLGNGQSLWHIFRDMLAAAPQPPVAAQEPIEVHEPKCPALIGDACTCDRHGPAADKAWARFCAKIGDGPNAPYPGMISAFERYYAQSFTDKDWRREASVWAAAWKQAMLAAAPTTQPAPVAHGDALDEVRRAVAAIAVVGHVDGHAVVRRLSVLDMLDRRIAARAQAKEGRDMAITKQQRAALREKFDGRCAYCGHPLGEKWHADGGSA